MRNLWLASLLAVMLNAQAQPEGIRGACGIFIERAAHNPRSIEWIEQSSWTVVDNRDGTYSVGARYRAATPAGGLKLSYTNCIIRPRSGNFDLVKLTQLL